MKKRIYLVQQLGNDNDLDRLVDATSRSAALAHVANKMFRVHVATARHLATLLPEGVKVEEAGEPE